MSEDQKQEYTLKQTLLALIHDAKRSLETKNYVSLMLVLDIMEKEVIDKCSS